MPKPTPKQLEAFRKLGLSEAEIAEVLKADAEIEKGKKQEFDLTAEQMKEAKKYTKAERAPVVYKLDNEGGKRSRKENATKAGIISEIYTFLMENANFTAENVEITNKERQIAFESGGEKFELTLVQKRKPKN